MRLPLLILSLSVSVICNSSIAGAQGAPQEPVPPYRALIRAALSDKKYAVAELLELQKKGLQPPVTISTAYAPYDISGARQVDAVGGWSWLVCLKGVNIDKTIYYSVFIRENKIADARLSVATDFCSSQKFDGPFFSKGRTKLSETPFDDPTISIQS